MSIILSASYLQQVAEFHKLFGAPVLSNPAIPPDDRQKLRESLIAEELKELTEAFEENDLVATLDAFCDLQYVLSGAILECGLQQVFDDGFWAVHQSNMTKACKTLEEAEQTVQHYCDKGVETYHQYNEEFKVYVVYRKADNKVLKSINYKPVQLEGFLQ